MKKFAGSLFKNIRGIGLTLVVWAVTAWLVYPLFTISDLETWNPEAYTVRAILGIIILILFFGKTVFDLFFPLDNSMEKSWVHSIFLTIYGVVLAVGILYLAGRLIVIYFKSQNTDFFTG
jgi:hypothetical protein